MKKYLLIQKADDCEPKQVYRIIEFDSVQQAYGQWIKDGFRGYISKKIEPKVVEGT